MKKVTNETIKKLIILKNVKSYYWNVYSKIRDKMHNNKCPLKIISAKYNDEFDEKYKKIKEDLLSKENIWCTYDKCTSSKLYIDNGNYIVNVKNWNGDLVNGYPTNLKWEAVFQLDEKTVVEIFKDRIDGEFIIHLEDLYEQELESKRIIRIKEIESELLTN